MNHSAASHRLGQGLVYVTPDLPGLQRVLRGRSFAYRQPDGNWVRDRDEIVRLNALAIPPAYTNVWICPLPNGHLQATGIDARGRRQYRYHERWRKMRDAHKFDRMQAFAQALPRIRARVQKDLRITARQPLGRPAVLAAIVRLLDTTFMRVGNEEYAAANGSYGLTTLRNRHVRLGRDKLQLRFKGKSGVEQQASLDDARVVRIVRRCQQLPGQELFQYEDEQGERHVVTSGDVNDYLREMATPRGGEQVQEGFTAKDFRTWHGSALALELTRLACQPGSGDVTGERRNHAKEILAEVARQLGNTPAVCRKSYIHPAILELGSRLSSDAGPDMQALWQRIGGTSTPRGLSAAERRLSRFLSSHSR